MITTCQIFENHRHPQIEIEWTHDGDHNFGRCKIVGDPSIDHTIKMSIVGGEFVVQFDFHEWFKMPFKTIEVKDFYWVTEWAARVIRTRILSIGSRERSER
jgi:hypothetical protein